jgi:hypothetical protein
MCRPKGSFLQGSCESLSLSSAAGDIGRIEAVKVWHEPTGAAVGGGWCLQQVDVEAVLRGGCGDVLYACLAVPHKQSDMKGVGAVQLGTLGALRLPGCGTSPQEQH